jgi:hypothetical protein
VFILEGVKVICFHRLLQVFILRKLASYERYRRNTHTLPRIH